jgi:hypothetical protein
MKTILKFSVFFFAVSLTACEKPTPEELPETFDFKIVDGMIQSPKWLAKKVEEVADRYLLTPSGEKNYPWVYGIEHKGHEYILVHDGFTGTVVGSYLFFTFSGESVIGGGELWWELYEATRLPYDNELLWRYEYRPMNSKSILTRADRQISFLTPNGNPVPDTWVRDEQYITSADIAAGRAFFKSTYPNAQEVSGPSTTYNCHGYVWSVTEGGSRVWIGYDYPGATYLFVNDGYVATSSNTPGAKVRYLNADHSAIAETSDIFVSKWNEYPLYRHNKNYSPFGSSPQLAYYIPFQPVITGNNPTALNVNATYSVTAPPTGVTFDGWEISRSNYQVSSGLGSRNLIIKFTDYGPYTLTANFTLSDGSDYPTTKTFTLSPPTPAPQVPLLMNVGGYVRPATIQVRNHIRGALYEWETMQGQIVEQGADYVKVIPQYSSAPSGPRTVPVRARMIIASVPSAWSSWLSVTLPLSMPIEIEK